MLFVVVILIALILLVGWDVMDDVSPQPAVGPAPKPVVPAPRPHGQRVRALAVKIGSRAYC